MSGKRLTEFDVTIIVRELERWRDGQLGSKLTWAILASTYGYSRQALQAHTRIKAAYNSAKSALRGGLVKSRAKYSEEFETLNARIVTLQSTVNEYERREKEWQKRWQRIAYHIRAKGLNVTEIDSDFSTSIVSAPNQKETEKIIRPFDQPMMPTGRK